MKLETLLEVAFKKRKVVRNGKVIKKKKCPPGYKLSGNKCVKQGFSERIARRRGAKIGSKQSKADRIRNRKKSFKIRKRRGL